MRFIRLLLVMVPAAGTICGQTSPLAGTSWRLVQFQGGDDTKLVPADKNRYTLMFNANGRVAVRIDCNRGNGTWKSIEPGKLEFGPMALTMAACPPAPLNDNLAKQWTYVRSYVMKNGNLFLSLMADGGIYEFEPMPRPPKKTTKKPPAAK
ncbi:MAG: META domain-containing protein [Bryobacteraceae bacterium]|nr:META domain-containing protein [Bryobacteraceae bacterium]